MQTRNAKQEMHETRSMCLTYIFESIGRWLTLIIRDEKKEWTPRRRLWSVTTSPSVRVSAGGRPIVRCVGTPKEGWTVSALVFDDRPEKRKDSPATNTGTSSCSRSVSRLSWAYWMLSDVGKEIKSSSLDAVWCSKDKKWEREKDFYSIRFGERDLFWSQIRGVPMCTVGW